MTDKNSPTSSQRTVMVREITFNNTKPLVLVAGVNVLEDLELTRTVAKELKTQCTKLNVPLVFKASFDKANRTSKDSYRGVGLKEGYEIFARVKEEFALPLITDIHEPEQAEVMAKVCDVLQIPAFLARQTDLVVAIAATGRVINIKKPQFLAPDDMKPIVEKCKAAGNDKVILCERGSSFGYHNLVVDMLGIEVMKESGYPVMFDVTHSLQIPTGLGHAAGGRGKYAHALARAGVALGLSSLFVEVHPDPSKARCDGPSALPLGKFADFLKDLVAIDGLIKK